jgi:DNA-binding FadR family transcriptional regulator
MLSIYIAQLPSDFWPDFRWKISDRRLRELVSSIRRDSGLRVILGLLSDDLAPGERLLSTRELAQGFRLHANTVSADYRQLEREHWVELGHGSGVYVRGTNPKARSLPYPHSI